MQAYIKDAICEMMLIVDSHFKAVKYRSSGLVKRLFDNPGLRLNDRISFSRISYCSFNIKLVLLAYFCVLASQSPVIASHS